MSLLIERARELLKRGSTEKAVATTLENEGESSWQSSESYKYKEWHSPDGKREILVSLSGGPDYDNFYSKEICLFATSKWARGKTLIMGAKAVVEPDDEEAKHIIFLEAITGKESGWILTNVVYSSDNKGRMHLPCRWSSPIRRGEYEGLSDNEFHDQFIKEMVSEGVYHLTELPPEIDIEATLEAFRDQVKRLDFSKPKLIPNRSSILDNSTPLVE